MDFERYNFTLDCDHPEWLTDKRHIEVIYEFIMANDFNRVAEIGSYSGASTAAFIEALNQGKDFNLHIAEINPTRQLRALISTCKKPDNVILIDFPGFNMVIMCLIESKIVNVGLRINPNIDGNPKNGIFSS